MRQIYPNGNGLATGDNGLIGILQRFAAAAFHFHLFSNNVTITKATTLSGLTELIATGYAQQSVAAVAFTLVGVVNDNGSIMAAPIGFGTNTSGSSKDTYGYYITDNSDGVLFAAANWDSPPITTLNGGAWPVVIPVFGDFSQYTS